MTSLSKHWSNNSWLNRHSCLLTEHANAAPIDRTHEIRPTEKAIACRRTIEHRWKALNVSIHSNAWRSGRATSVIEQDIRSAGLQAWVFSHPYQGNRQGGDIHYLSLCVGGIVTRIVLADVSGHGDRVARTSKVLLNLLRKFMNTKKQDRLVTELNRHFTETDDKDGFATAIVATYLSHKSMLLLTNAGHPRR